MAEQVRHCTSKLHAQYAAGMLYRYHGDTVTVLAPTWEIARTARVQLEGKKYWKVHHTLAVLDLRVWEHHPYIFLIVSGWRGFDFICLYRKQPNIACCWLLKHWADWLCECCNSWGTRPSFPLKGLVTYCLVQQAWQFCSVSHHLHLGMKNGLSSMASTDICLGLWATYTWVLTPRLFVRISVLEDFTP